VSADSSLILFRWTVTIRGGTGSWLLQVTILQRFEDARYFLKTSKKASNNWQLLKLQNEAGEDVRAFFSKDKNPQMRLIETHAKSLAKATSEGYESKNVWPDKARGVVKCEWSLVAKVEATDKDNVQIKWNMLGVGKSGIDKALIRTRYDAIVEEKRNEPTSWV